MDQFTSDLLSVWAIMAYSCGHLTTLPNNAKHQAHSQLDLI